MKKALLVSIFLLFTTLTVFAYETVIIKFPSGEIWDKVFYKKVATESILQYVPRGQTRKDWQKAIIIHAYKDSAYPVSVFLANNIAMMTKNNPTSPYKYLRLNDHEGITGRCTKDYNGIKAQCEIFRATYAHNGIISIHYINKDRNDFIENYNQWYDIIRKAKFLHSYWRNERTFNKSEYFELW